MKIKGIKIKEDTHTALLKKQIEVMEKTGDKPNIVDLASELIEKGLSGLDEPQTKASKPKK